MYEVPKLDTWNPEVLIGKVAWDMEGVEPSLNLIEGQDSFLYDVLFGYSFYGDQYLDDKQIVVATTIYDMLIAQLDKNDSGNKLPPVSKNAKAKWDEIVSSDSTELSDRVHDIENIDSMMYKAMNYLAKQGRTPGEQEILLLHAGIIYLLLHDSLEYTDNEDYRLDVFREFLNDSEDI